ncbi:MAG TPA: fumarylacetoacetate hydrolase family protein [Gammaproteobacteria bacterium]|nr:fumarylacetoacetate hydrolase family protein [Gammaproteobacteria bacterium]
MVKLEPDRYLTRHQTAAGPRWAINGLGLPDAFHLDLLLQRSLSDIEDALDSVVTEEPVEGALMAPIEDTQEVWAAGVTYVRSREARVAESSTADLYQRVYDADRVELFFKAVGWRVLGHGDAVRVRRDSNWNVPEPELTLLVNRAGEPVGYTAGNDVSSRDIEGQNPLYLPQAKIYDGACALGPGIVIASADAMRALPIRMTVERSGEVLFAGETSTTKLKRSLEEMVRWLTRELSFPEGAFLMTGTGLVPPDEFSLAEGDEVRIEVGGLMLENRVA